MMDARPNSRQEKAGGQPRDFSANNNLQSPNAATNRDAEKCFSTWQAKYAICGHTLYRTACPDSSILYSASRWGLAREMKSIEAVAAFFAMIGGKA